MKNKLSDEFQAKRQRLIYLCRTIADAVMRTDYRNAKEVQVLLLEAGLIIEESTTIDDQRSAGGSIRSLFHKEGFHEYPGPVDFPSWDSDLSELFDLSSLYAEAKYKKLYAEHDNQGDG
jgi:hypothetical protein